MTTPSSSRPPRAGSSARPPKRARKAGQPVSVAARKWARTQRTGSIATKAALLVLADYANAEGVCWPGVNSLAEDACTDERTMRRLLGRLSEAGLVEIESRAGRPSVYRLQLSTPGSDPGVTPGPDPGVTPGDDPARGESPDSDQTPGPHPGHPGATPRGPRGDTPPNRKEPSGTKRSTHARASAHPDPDKPPAVPFPDGWTPHDGHRRTAHAQHVDLDHEAGQFEAHARANARTVVDWDQAFALWLGNAKRRGPNPWVRRGDGPAPINANDANIAAFLRGSNGQPPRPAIESGR